MLNLNTDEEVKYLEFTVNGGKKVYKIPYLQCIPSDPYIDDLLAAAALSDSDQYMAVLSLFCKVLDDYAPDVRKQFTIDTIKKLMEAWQGDSAVSMGE